MEYPNETDGPPHNNIYGDAVDIFRNITSMIPSQAKNVIASTLLIVGTYGIANAQESATGFPYQATVAIDNLRLRQSPNFYGEILGKYDAGQKVTVLGIVKSDEIWNLVDINSDGTPDGYMAGRYLRSQNSQTASFTFNAPFCGLTKTEDGDSGVDSENGLCSVDYKGSTVLYAHNYTDAGKSIEGLYHSEPGTIIQDVVIDGVDYGAYKVVKSYQATGYYISQLISPEISTAQNNDYILLLTTNKQLESVDPKARLIVLAQKVN